MNNFNHKNDISSEIYKEVMNNIDSTWLNVQEKLKKEVGEATFNSWLSKLKIKSVEGSEIKFQVTTKFMREWVLTHYKDLIIKFWREYDETIYSLEIVIESNQENNKNYHKNFNNINNSSSIISDDTVANANFSFKEGDLSAVLDKRFTFDNYVVGAPNQLGYAAARSVAESAEVKSESNPLFLYGGVGLGKTHLMHSIAWHISENDQTRKVIYISAEKFMYSFVKALREKQIMSFKEYFRSVDVLMIDDVQFICGKNSTQEEFFHTFNTLIDNNCQVVISADRSPSDLDGMEERIKSRLGWGLVVDVHSTTYELRLGILQSKIEKMSVTVPDSVIEFLAAKITSNVRELEGALNKVLAHSTLVNQPINLENTMHILKDLLRSHEKTLTVEEIQRKVCDHFNVKISDMSSSRRARYISRPRQIAMYLAKHHTSTSLSEIGKRFGGKDHTTVMHAIKMVDKLIDNDQEIKEDIKILNKIFEI